MADTVLENYDLRCPACGSDEDLLIQFTTWGELAPRGLTDNGDHAWDSDSECRCQGCNHAGKVRDFGVNDAWGEATNDQPVTQ